MFQRDFVMNEARKFALLLAKLLGLKAEGEYEEYLSQFNNALQEEFDMEPEELVNLGEEGFRNRLIQANYSAEKLNALSQLLYLFAEPFEATEETAELLKKVLILFDLLETKHHYQSFDNLAKRTAIYNFFKNNYEQT